MNETSYLDLQMLDIIKMALKNDEIDNEIISKNLYEEIEQLLISKLKFVSSCKENKNFNKLSKDNFIFSSDFKIKSLSNLLDYIGIDNFSEAYKEEIISVRNKFAHAVLIKDDQGREYFKHGESGLTFDEELCKTIRKNITKHKSNFVNIIPYIKKE